MPDTVEEGGGEKRGKHFLFIKIKIYLNVL